MKKFWMCFALLVVLGMGFVWSGCEVSASQARVLVFSKTAGFRHSSIEDGLAAIKKLGRENNFQVIHSEDAAVIKEEYLQRFATVIFLNTTGDILNNIQEADLERFVQAGGGFVGIHAAADTEYDWSWYGRLVGAYFNGHPSDPNVRTATLHPVIADHPATAMLPENWERTDEWYNYKGINPDIKVLVKLDESTYEGGTNGDDHPIAWYHDYDGGRAFFTGGGHTSESFEEPLFLAHLLGGIQYAIGENKLNYAQAKSKRVPPENRFVKTVLAQNLNEPMELDVFDDGRIILIERKGAVKLYDPEREVLDSINGLEVYFGQEDGLLGLAIDPDFERTNWVYLCYSPAGDEPKQHVSRFTFDGNKLDLSSEQVIIKIPVQRDECCHSGGAIEFDSSGNLYIGLGDDTNPFASDGYAPIDERPGRTPWDAQRTSGNMNDLRGGILRITPKKDGPGYTIPEGNLFPEGTPGTRPELYAKGARNPFRFSIDSRTGYLYWGDVGPDAGVDGEGRGPKGIDEINQARLAGYFGWPYFRGDRVYNDYDFATQRSGQKFNPEKPINASVNNTGIRELPPFQKPLIWYSYDKSNEFPWVGIGGKNPMAGPIYYSDSYEGENKFPDYFDGRLIIYEWMRNWIFVVKLDEKGDFAGVDPFLPNVEFSRPMDMVFSKDGTLYTLEYGQKWVARNMDARLSRIDYIKGNRKPIAKIEADQLIGAAPLTVRFRGDRSIDYDEDELSYEWSFAKGAEKSKSPNPSFIFESPGIYEVTLKVTDKEGSSSSTAKQQIQVGNDPPVIAWQLEGNQSFYYDNRVIPYRVIVRDKEDGSTADNTISANQVSVSFDYVDQAYDLTEVAQGHLAAMSASMESPGESLIDQSDCQTCHALDKKINGPSYQDIAQRYKGEKDAPAYLATKVIKGGSGVWGETPMSAHPQLTEAQVGKMVDYILSVNEERSVASDFPLEGQFVAKDHLNDKQKGSYVMMAVYSDKGSGNVESITAQEKRVLIHPKVRAGSFDMEGGEISAMGDRVGILKHNAHLGFRKLDLTDISELILGVGPVTGDNIGGAVELRLDALDGPSLGVSEIPVLTNGRNREAEVRIPLEGVAGPHDIYFIFRNGNNDKAMLTTLSWIYFKNKHETVGLTLR